MATLDDVDNVDYALHLPPEHARDELDQDQEWCEIEINGERQRIRFHDYASIYNVPGLYERLFAEQLECDSPRFVTELLGAELRTARTQFDTAATLETWGAALALLAALWWPAAPIALILGTIAWYRGRATVTTYTDLVEAAIDLHGRELAITVGGPTIDNQLTTEVGHTITRLFRKGA